MRTSIVKSKWTALRAQAGELGISKVVKGGGFKHFRCATNIPFNIVYEAKP
jgi:hypothetical protein